MKIPRIYLRWRKKGARTRKSREFFEHGRSASVHMYSPVCVSPGIRRERQLRRHISLPSRWQFVICQCPWHSWLRPCHVGQNSNGSGFDCGPTRGPEPRARWRRHSLMADEGRSIIKVLSCQYDIWRGGLRFVHKRDSFLMPTAVWDTQGRETGSNDVCRRDVEENFIYYANVFMKLELEFKVGILGLIFSSEACLRMGSVTAWKEQRRFENCYVTPPKSTSTSHQTSTIINIKNNRVPISKYE